MEEMWQEKMLRNPLVKEFTVKFGGEFGIHITGLFLFYSVKINNKWQIFNTADDETKVLNMLRQSINAGKILLPPSTTVHSRDRLE